MSSNVETTNPNPKPTPTPFSSQLVLPAGSTIHTISSTATLDGDNPNPNNNSSTEPNDTTTANDHDDLGAASYIRDPHKLIAYLIPFPSLEGVETVGQVPFRFLIYTPPPPPLQEPALGDKESTTHKIQRKWQEEVREAVVVDSKREISTWKGLMGRTTKALNHGLEHTTSPEVDFLNRVPTDHASIFPHLHLGKHCKCGRQDKDKSAKCACLGESEDTTTKAEVRSHTHKDKEKHHSETKGTVGLNEIVFVYPPSMGDDPALLQQVIDSLLRTSAQSQKNALIAGCLLPLMLIIEIFAVPIWPLGAAAMVGDGVWGLENIRSEKAGKSLAKRLAASTVDGRLEGNDGKFNQVHHQGEEPTLKVTFKQSSRVDVLAEYLLCKCSQQSVGRLLVSPRGIPTEIDVLYSIGWQPSGQLSLGIAKPAVELVLQPRNFEEEAWEEKQVEHDLRETMGKAAREWEKWIIGIGERSRRNTEGGEGDERGAMQWL